MKKKKKVMSSLSKVDILKERIDTIFTKNGLNPPSWKEKKGFGVYFPKQKNKQKNILKSNTNMDIKDLKNACSILGLDYKKFLESPELEKGVKDQRLVSSDI